MKTERTLRFLAAADVRQALPMPEAIAAMRAAFRELSECLAVVPPRVNIAIPEHKGDVLFMPAYSPAARRLGLKVITLFEDNRALGLPFIQALVMIFDAQTGSPIAIMDGTTLTALRTGGASGVATDLLARPDASRVAIFGAGIQARTQLEAVCAVRPIRTARIFDVDRVRAEAFAEEARTTLKISATAVATPAAALDGAEVVCTATTSTTPVFSDHELPPGAHINAVGSYKPYVREIPAATVVRATVVVDQTASAWEEAGDLIMPRKDGLITAHHIQAELGEIIAGRKQGRRDRDEVTLFKSVGLAIQDLVAADYALAKAEALQMGTCVPV